MSLFETFDLAGLQLPNRIVMAPMTRSRAPTEVADDLTAIYYQQRATAGLIISEGAPISRPPTTTSSSCCSICTTSRGCAPTST